jgi:hypothetical protein
VNTRTRAHIYYVWWRVEQFRIDKYVFKTDSWGDHLHCKNALILRSRSFKLITARNQVGTKKLKLKLPRQPLDLSTYRFVRQSPLLNVIFNWITSRKTRRSIFYHYYYYYYYYFHVIIIKKKKKNVAIVFASKYIFFYNSGYFYRRSSSV